MTGKKQRCEFDPQDLDEIMDQIAARRAAKGPELMGHGRSLITGQEWLQVRDEDGTIRQVPLN